VPFQETESLTLRAYDYGDTSQVVHLLTESSGKIHVIAKGARRPKNSFQGPLDLLVHGRAGFYPRPKTGLHLLGTFEVLDAFPRTRSELSRYYVACHVLEALHEATRQEQPGRRAFALGLAALRVVEKSRDPARVVPVFHADLLRQLGTAPRLDACVSCETPIEEVRSARLSPTHGGLLCEGCHPGDRMALEVSPEVAGRLAELMVLPFREGLQVEMEEGVRGRVRGLLAGLLRFVLEKDLRTLRWVGQ